MWRSTPPETPLWFKLLGKPPHDHAGMKGRAMYAVGILRPGGLEVLQLIELPLPEPGRGEVRIRTVAAAVNHTDIILRQFGPPDQAKLPPPWIPGMELSGLSTPWGRRLHGALATESWGSSNRVGRGVALRLSG